MAFIISSPNSSVEINDVDEEIFNLPEKYKLNAPEIDKLWSNFYGDPKISTASQVKQFRSEVEQILKAYQKERRKFLIHDKKLHSKDPAVIDNILDRLMKKDQRAFKLNELIKLCDEAIALNEGLICSSD